MQSKFREFKTSGAWKRMRFFALEGLLHLARYDVKWYAIEVGVKGLTTQLQTAGLRGTTHPIESLFKTQYADSLNCRANHVGQSQVS